MWFDDIDVSKHVDTDTGSYTEISPQIKGFVKEAKMVYQQKFGYIMLGIL